MNRIAPIPNLSPTPPTALDASPILVSAGEYSAAHGELLSPFGRAAKAIFVKANGLAAYLTSLRAVHRAD